MSEEKKVAIVTKAICKSRKFETGEGTCAMICLQHLGSARRNCSYTTQVHGELAATIIEALEKEE